MDFDSPMLTNVLCACKVCIRFMKLESLNVVNIRLILIVLKVGTLDLKIKNSLRAYSNVQLINDK